MPNRELKNVLEASANALRQTLVGAELQSCLSDELWMQRESTADEWGDFLEFTRNYIEEVVRSDDVDSIIFSDPGSYPWKTWLVRSRVDERFAKWGPVDELFKNPETRHLVELTEPLRALSKVLERQTQGARRQFAERNSMFDAARSNELLLQRSIISRSKQRECANYFFDLLSDEASNVARYRGQQGSCLSLSIFGELDGIDNGFVGLRIMESGAMTPIRRISFHRALPSNFNVYSNFHDVETAVLSFRAWKLVLKEIDQRIRSIGWCSDASRLLEALDRAP